MNNGGAWEEAGVVYAGARRLPWATALRTIRRYVIIGAKAGGLPPESSR
ncbi:MAG: hypothetical protein AAGA18_11310 [Verrucomicrobiota bacterium]